MENDDKYYNELSSLYSKIRPDAYIPEFDPTCKVLRTVVDPSSTTRGLHKVSRGDFLEALEKIDPNIAMSLLNSSLSKYEKELLSQPEGSEFYAASKNVMEKVDITERLKNELMNGDRYKDFDFSKYSDKEGNVDLVGLLKGVNDFQMEKLQTIYPHVSVDKNRNVDNYVSNKNVNNLFNMAGNGGMRNLQRNMLSDNLDNENNKKRKHSGNSQSPKFNT